MLRVAAPTIWRACNLCWEVAIADSSFRGTGQIGLVDMLKDEYGITPAGVLGHSAGPPLLGLTPS